MVYVRRLSVRGMTVMAATSVLLLALTGVASAGFRALGSTTELEFDPGRVCRDGADSLVLTGGPFDDPSSNIAFDLVAAFPPPEGDIDDPDSDPFPPEETIVVEKHLKLTYVKGGLLVDVDGDGFPEEDPRYFRKAFKVRWQEGGQGKPVILEPGDVVEFDFDEGNTIQTTAKLTVVDCFLRPQPPS